MANIDIAQREYYRRPKDQRLESVAALVNQAASQKANSREKQYNAKDLRTEPTDAGNELALISPNGARATFTHWSFGQMCRSIGAPAAYLRDLPPELAAQCINHGLRETPPASDFNLLIEGIPTSTDHSTPPKLKVRAATSETYGRVWDADLYGMIQDQIMAGGKFIVPPSWDGTPSGAYRSDRDSFLIIVNGGSIVSDPSLVNRTFTAPPITRTGALPSQANDAGAPTDALFRGLIVRNSEVGASSIEIMQILFRYICGNHMLWGAVMDQQYRRRHVGAKTLRDTVREIQRIAFNWTNATASRDERIIQSLIDHEIARTREGVIDELIKIGFTKKAAQEAYDTCERTEYASPRSFWGIAQGATRASQATGYQDQRYELDQLAAKILQRGAKQFVTV